MNSLYIVSKNVNLEIMSKLLNSVARKYDCYVQYIAQENCLKFHGDERYWRHIAEEVMEYFFPKTALQPAAIKI